MPLYSNVDVRKQPFLLRALSAHMRRPDYSLISSNMNESSPPSGTHSDQFLNFRFQTINRESLDADVQAFPDSIVNADVILANYPLMQPFFGQQSCSYCHDVVKVTEPRSYLSHLLENHLEIFNFTFSCPACMGISLHSRKSFQDHFTKIHAPNSSFVNLCTEHALGIRYQHAILINFLVEMCNQFPTVLASVETVSDYFYASAIGGYTSGDSEFLHQSIVDKQMSDVPEKLKHLLSEQPSGDHPEQQEQMWTEVKRSRKITLPLSPSYAEKTREKRQEPERSSRQYKDYPEPERKYEEMYDEDKYSSTNYRQPRRYSPHEAGYRYRNSPSPSYRPRRRYSPEQPTSRAAERLRRSPSPPMDRRGLRQPQKRRARSSHLVKEEEENY